MAGNGHRGRRRQARRQRRCRAAPYLWHVAQAGHAGLRGLLRVPLAQDNATREALGARMAAALRRGRLTIAALGDSITAGHDNFYNQSWVPQLRGLLAAPLQEVGIELVVENFAVGNMGEYPWTAGCLNHRLGDRLARAVDLVTWNWALYDDAPCAREHFLAEVAALPGRPIILQLQDHDVPLHACVGERVRRAQAALGSRLLGRGRANLARERIFPRRGLRAGGRGGRALSGDQRGRRPRRAQERRGRGRAACASEGGTPAATSWRPRRPPWAMRRRVRSWLPRARRPILTRRRGVRGGARKGREFSLAPGAPGPPAHRERRGDVAARRPPRGRRRRAARGAGAAREAGSAGEVRAADGLVFVACGPVAWGPARHARGCAGRLARHGGQNRTRLPRALAREDGRLRRQHRREERARRRPRRGRARPRGRRAARRSASPRHRRDFGDLSSLVDFHAGATVSPSSSASLRAAATAARSTGAS